MTTPKPQGVLIEQNILHVLDEAGAGLSRIFAHWAGQGFVILTSWRSEKTAKTNLENFAALKHGFAANGFGWIPLWGRWRDLATGNVDREPSLLIPAIKRDGKPAMDELHDLALQFGHAYEQQAVLIVQPGAAKLYKTDVSPPHLLQTFTSMSAVKLANVFSELAKKAGRSFVFEGLDCEDEPKGWAEAMERAASGEIRDPAPPKLG